MDYPFICNDIFLINLAVSREQDMSSESGLELEGQVKITLDNYPETLQVNCRLRSKENCPLKIQIELVGLFGYTGKTPEEDKKIINDFLNKSGIPILWPTFLPVLRSTAATMGVHGINIRVPTKFEFEFSYKELLDDGEHKP